MSKSSQEKNTQININIESEVKKLIKNPLTYAGNEEIEKLVLQISNSSSCDAT